MELRDYLKTIARRWPTIIALTLIGMAVAAVLTITSTRMYSSSAQMFVSTSQADSGQAYQGELFSQQRAQSYARLLSGEEIARRVVKTLDLSMTPAELSDEISASVVLDTVLLEVTVTDERAQRAQQIAKTLSEEFVGYVAELETPEGLDAAPIKATVVDPASFSGDPVSPKPVLNLSIGLILGLALGLVTAVLREVIDSTIKSPEDLARTIDSPLLGTITFDKSTPKSPLITSLGTHHPRVEAFRILRTNLQFIDIDSSNRVFVITSSVPSEGKSTTAANVAIATALGGRRVALVEGDLRRPRIREYFGVEGAVGVTTTLIGRVTLDAALQEHSPTPGLDILTSGTLPPNPSELLQTNAMAELIDDLRQRYDVVFIDAPPLLPVTDAAILSTLADGVILVIRHGKTSREQLRSAVERLEAVGGRLLGTVINMTPARGTGRYAYGYGYGYGENVDGIPPLPDSGRRGRLKSQKS